MRKLQASGVAYPEIASRFNSTVPAIKRLMSRNREQFKPRKKEGRWTKPQILKMQKLWVDGKTYSDIAKAFNVSRSAMSGFISRNPEFFVPKGTPREKETVARIAKAKARQVTVEEPPRAIPHPEGATGTPWVDLAADQCQWHLNDGMDHFHDPPSNKFPCCGLPVMPGKRFCEYHVKAARK